MCYMSDDGQVAAEQELIQYRRTVEGRDDMVRRARAAGVSKNRIHVLTGIARTTIDRILKEEG
jgi:DNA-binding phage protein